MSADQKIRSILEHYKNLGLCTHAFASYAQVKTGSVLICEEISLDHAVIFDVASMSKALVTAPLLCSLLGVENIKTLKVGDIKAGGDTLPRQIEALAIKDLLSHKSGLPAWYNFYVCHMEQGPRTLDEQHAWLIKRLNDLCKYWGKDFKRGKDLYSDVGFIILGLILERYTQKSISSLFRVFLGTLSETNEDQELFHNEMFVGIKPQHISADQVVPTGWCFLRQRMLRGEVWDENAAALGGAAGHCGLFASGRALNQYLCLLLKSEVGRTWFDSQFKQQESLGLRSGDDPTSNVFCQGKALGHMGFVGTAFWLCPLNGTLAVLLTNRVISGRINPLIKDMRKEVFSEFGKRNRHHR